MTNGTAPQASERPPKADLELPTGAVSIEALAASLSRYPRAPDRKFNYGTAGFRAKADLLPSVVHRCGLLAALFAVYQQDKKEREARAQAGAKNREAKAERYAHSTAVYVGCMITASHNPEEDNGVKLVGVDGCLLSPVWERYAESLINSACFAQPASQNSVSVAGSAQSERTLGNGKIPHDDAGRGCAESVHREVKALTQIVHELFGGNDGDTTDGDTTDGMNAANGCTEPSGDEKGKHSSTDASPSVLFPCVLVGRDNRPSSKSLQAAFESGVRTLGVQVVSLGQVTTGQLQFIVRRQNERSEDARRCANAELTAGEVLEDAHRGEPEEGGEGTALVRDYYVHFSKAFSQFMVQARQLKRVARAGSGTVVKCAEAPHAGDERKDTGGSPSPLSLRALYVDAANGVGGASVKHFSELLSSESGLSLFVRNEGRAGGESDGQAPLKEGGRRAGDESAGAAKKATEIEGLNFLCGAEHVQKRKALPRNFGYRGDPTEGALCASFDGDADRLIFFTWEMKQAPYSAFPSLSRGTSALQRLGSREEVVRGELQRAFSLSDGFASPEACSGPSREREEGAAANEGRGADSGNAEEAGTACEARSAVEAEGCCRASCADADGGASLSENAVKRMASSALDVSAENAIRMRLYDGDRIACLVTLALISLLKQALGKHEENDKQPRALTLSICVVQTAYANGGSTAFLEQLQAAAQPLASSGITFELACVPTGVKHLHRRAAEATVGVYFEANGHGTVVHDEARLSEWAAERNLSTVEEWQLLTRFLHLFNAATGDALADLLAVVAALSLLDMTPQQWSDLYDDRPCYTLKVALPRRVLSTLKPDPRHEKRLLEMPALQARIDEAVEATAPFCRGFVRPSGTEDVCRIYAEAPDLQSAKTLGRLISELVVQHAQAAEDLEGKL
ncbi:phosphoacetylglucosamine mutase [Besnoitia besnoiti]|uniref:Phosphoacetylglucosamine mutase n=1 Tax=Besnoitia besnoiti TaxID=94643 RepID=A0A2A9MDN0_BESBE|nr:phosphoacetylglucosamine mutase [Besnoitia besnoiti]PFH36608.1 phosphoacetylglucosamine mutase [Besnoitia besnoiti]